MAVSTRKRRTAVEMGDPPLVLRLKPTLNLTEDQFFELCQINDELRIERNAAGELLIMPPAGGGTSHRNADITGQLWAWATRDGTGVVFDSSAGYRLPNGAVRSPDASWVVRERWDRASAEQREKFAPLCPDFVVELRSPSDRLRDLQAKMAEYIANGARLAWLVDPIRRRIEVYRPGAPVEQLHRPDSVAGDPVLPGFVLDLRPIW